MPTCTSTFVQKSSEDNGIDRLPFIKLMNAGKDGAAYSSAVQLVRAKHVKQRHWVIKYITKQKLASFKVVGEILVTMSKSSEWGKIRSFHSNLNVPCSVIKGGFLWCVLRTNEYENLKDPVHACSLCLFHYGLCYMKSKLAKKYVVVFDSISRFFFSRRTH